LVRQFCEKHPADDNLRGDAAIIPVLYIQAPPIPDEGRFYNAILDKLFAPYRPSENINTKQFQSMTILKRVGTRLLIIDEIHQILAGSLNKQRAFLNVLKYFGNELMIPIVGVGTNDAFRAIQTDPQLANRFEPFQLPCWELGEEFLRLLVSFERLIPLAQSSNLYERGLAAQIYSMSEGYIGEVSKLLTCAAVEAVKSGHEKIDLQLIKSLDWCPPSGRRYRPETDL